MKKPFSGGLSSAIDKILIFLISCFVLQLFFELIMATDHGSGPLFDYIGFSSRFISSGHVWSIFTYPFLHEGPFHLIINLIGIHFICRAVEQDMGSRNFFWLCALGSLIGAFFWLAFNYTGRPLTGFTSIVMASITFFCFQYPERPITLLLFFIFPITIKPKFLLLGLLGLELFGFVFWEFRNNEPVNYSSHLGGMLAGAFVYRYLHSGKEFPRFVFVKSNSSTHKEHTNPQSRKKSTLDPGYAVDFSDQQSLQEEVDRILDKINENGFGALTQEEKNTLDKAKGLLNRG
ncbi:MAG: rhomboid family intramembrane serine protease [Opitutae bacterium]|nr:rhomboid family intramembrane serine protease [Opitutae bacterium]